MNFVKNDILKMWILCCEKWDFEIVNFVESEILKMWIFGWIEDFCPSVEILDSYLDKWMVFSESWTYSKWTMALKPLKLVEWTKSKL